ncbi:MAG: hypothetical protein EOP05_03785 [Proteobacteria bacterium]|nr:MAG: hypothetical protein EOP05_03785 [Pseudomonadota bacterium]
MTLKSLVATAVCVLATTPAFAQGVKQKKALAEANQLISSYSDKLKENCGQDIKASLNTASFGNEETMKTATWGKDTMWALSSLCEDKDYKEAITKGVKQVVFKYDAGIKKDDHYGNKLELKGGTLTHSYNKDSANTGSEARDWLKANL